MNYSKKLNPLEEWRRVGWGRTKTRGPYPPLVLFGSRYTETTTAMLRDHFLIIMDQSRAVAGLPKRPQSMDCDPAPALLPREWRPFLVAGALGGANAPSKRGLGYTNGRGWRSFSDRLPRGRIASADLSTPWKRVQTRCRV